MNNATVYTEICNLKQAEDFLNQYDINYVSNIEYYLDELLMQRDTWTDFTQIEDDIKHQLRHIYNDFSIQFAEQNLQEIIQTSSNCVIFNKLHDFLMPLLYQQFAQDDEDFFNKCTALFNANVTAEQLGAPEHYAIPLLAAVVELASLDNHKSPLEKMLCLCTTYDLIFAELKTAFIDVISKFSATESEIPVINNSDIIPILMVVIIRSKLVHLCSNFYYIEAFIDGFNQKDDVRHVLNSFKEAVTRLKIMTKASLKPGCEKVCRDLDLIKLVKVTSEINTKLQTAKEVMTPLDGQMLRITDLIVTSTNENQPAL